MTNANQTLASGKVNELIELFVSEVDRLASRRNDGRIQAQPPLGPLKFSILDHALDALQNELAG